MIETAMDDEGQFGFTCRCHNSENREKGPNASATRHSLCTAHGHRPNTSIESPDRFHLVCPLVLKTLSGEVCVVCLAIDFHNIANQLQICPLSAIVLAIRAVQCALLCTEQTISQHTVQKVFDLFGVRNASALPHGNSRSNIFN